LTCPTIFVLSTADFDSSVWTNKQHLATDLADHYDVVYIESLGLRRPSFRVEDCRRIWSKLRGRGKRGNTAHTNSPASNWPRLRVISPRVLPFHANPLARFINTKLLARQIGREMKLCDYPGLWSFSPLMYDLDTFASMVVYHSVDLLHTLPGVPAAILLSNEKLVLATSHRIVASSRGVRDHLSSQGAVGVKVWENVSR
jgi:teichuronic acid biosynthesis glycosyltransferase TuaH